VDYRYVYLWFDGLTLTLLYSLHVDCDTSDNIINIETSCVTFLILDQTFELSTIPWHYGITHELTKTNSLFGFVCLSKLIRKTIGI
jgi:hypothetical protein